MKTPPPWEGSQEPEHIKRIRILFAARLSERVRRIEEGYRQLAERGESAMAGMRQLFLEAHRLAGSAESFGGVRLAEVAARIDRTLRTSYDQGTLPSAEAISSLPNLIGELDDAEKEFLRWMEGESDEGALEDEPGSEPGISEGGVS